MANVSIDIPILARVEGEGALALSLDNGQIKSLQLKIYEPPRLFEKFLEGRDYREVLDIVARICGICPVAYQMSAVHALEQCFQMTPLPWVREMRRLFYCGEWLESHNMHIHFLAAPDFLGCKTLPELAKKHPDVARRGLRLQALGNEIIKFLGARSVHPVGACVGGFFKTPSRSEATQLLMRLKEHLEDAENLVYWVNALSLPNNSHEFITVALKASREYPLNEGAIVSSQGLEIPIEEFEYYFKEFQVPYSNALHCTLQGKPYLVGPLARLNLNYDRLPSVILKLLEKLNIKFPSDNMFDSMLARAIEVYYCLLESIRVLEHYQPESVEMEVSPVSGVGFGCTEAPRGLLWHRYEIAADGSIKSAKIVPPTSQNQARIEEDLRVSLTQYGLNRSHESLKNYSEMLIRNYDPCISCSTHFLNLTING